MAVGPDAHQHDIEQWPGGIQSSGAVKRFQLVLVAARGLPGIGGAGRNRMDVGSRRATIQKYPPRRPHVVEGIVRRNKALVADEPMHAVPRYPASIAVGRKQSIEMLRARSAGQADRHATSVRRNLCQDTIRGGLRKRLGVRNRDHMAMIGQRHPINRASASLDRRA